VKRGVFTAYVNGEQIKFYDMTFPSGSIGLFQWYENWLGQKTRIAFDNIEVTPLTD